jgi:hypothetical protein
MTTSPTFFNNTSAQSVLPHDLRIDPNTSLIQHWDGAKYNSVGGFSPAFITSTSGIVTSITSTNGLQNTAFCYATYYIFVGGNTSGTVSVAIGSAASPTNYIIPSSAGNAANNHSITVRVPSMWYVKVATTNGVTVTSVNTLTEGSF